VVVRARAEGGDGLRDVAVGAARGKGLLAVYERVARVDVEPANAIARVGGPGDAQMEKVGVAYRALGWAAGRDGKAGTADDLRLGYLPVQWSIEAADEEAEKARDQDFVGRIGADGVFVPGDAGPNPARPKSLGNTGRVKVVAAVGEAGERVEGRGSLDVAVPDFVQRALD
jgi:quinohemoprotein amine dehydrogenase